MNRKKAILAIFMMAFFNIIGFAFTLQSGKSQKRKQKNPRQKILNTIIMKILRQNKQKIRIHKLSGFLKLLEDFFLQGTGETFFRKN